jgi:hypothetical protein
VDALFGRVFAGDAGLTTQRVNLNCVRIPDALQTGSNILAAVFRFAQAAVNVLNAGLPHRAGQTVRHHLAVHPQAFAALSLAADFTDGLCSAGMLLAAD